MNYRNNCVTRFYIIMTVTWLLAMVMSNNKIYDANNKCRKITGNFDGHADAVYDAGCIAQ